MAELPLEVLDSIVAGQIGATSRWRELPWDEEWFKTPMTLTVREVASSFSKRLRFYWLDSGLPEIYSLPGLNPIPVVFSSRFIEAGATLFWLVQSKWIGEDLASKLAERFSLQIAAELCLKNGDAGTACYFFVRSQTIDLGNTYIPSVNIVELEMEAINESYMTIWFYGLLHELGHAYVEEHGPVVPVDDEDLQTRIAEGFQKMGLAPELFGLIGGHLKSQGVGHALDRDLIASEISGDVFAVNALWWATPKLMAMEDRGDEFNPSALAMCIAGMYNALVMLNSCALTGHHGSDLNYARRHDPWISLAYQIRMELLVDYIATLLAGEAKDADTIARCRDSFAAATMENAGHLAAVESGISRAMIQAMQPSERPLYLGSQFYQLCLTGKVALHELARFIETAETFAVSHPDVATLKGVLEGRADPPQERVYCGLWLRRPDGSCIPFSLQAEHGRIVPVFLDQGDVYRWFRDNCANDLEEGSVLQSAAIRTHWEWEVTELCLHMLANEDLENVRVVIEGTRQFGQFINELRSGAAPT